MTKAQRAAYHRGLTAWLREWPTAKDSEYVWSNALQFGRIAEHARLLDIRSKQYMLLADRWRAEGNKDNKAACEGHYLALSFVRQVLIRRAYTIKTRSQDCGFVDLPREEYIKVERDLRKELYRVEGLGIPANIELVPDWGDLVDSDEKLHTPVQPRE